MEPDQISAVDHREELLLHRWRAQQLQRLGVSHITAEAFADRVDWHAVARLVQHGCAPELALEIVH